MENQAKLTHAAEVVGKFSRNELGGAPEAVYRELNEAAKTLVDAINEALRMKGLPGSAMLSGTAMGRIVPQGPYFSQSDEG